MFENIQNAYQISSKLVHAFGLQTPITAECLMRRCLRCHGNRIVGTGRGHDGM